MPSIENVASACALLSRGKYRCPFCPQVRASLFGLELHLEDEHADDPREIAVQIVHKFPGIDIDAVHRRS